MTNTPENLKHIESKTIGHYDDSAITFFERTKNHDVSQNYTAFLSSFPANKKLNILDFGCGPGRDLKHFQGLGHIPVGLDGSAKFCKMAQEYSGCEVLHQSFMTLSLPTQKFDGVFANASLFHVPANQLELVLNKLHDALHPNGILFMSNPRGEGEGWNGQRYGHYMEIESISGYLERSRFNVLNHYYRPEGLPIAQQPWLAVVSQRTN
jgi:SAM-dependent methyltransferase